MSTRSAIARLTSKPGKPITFKSVYHHWDGYPSGLGATLYTARNSHFKKDTKAMLKFLIDDHPAGFSTINGCDFNMPAGYVEYTTKAHGPICFCHGERHEEAFEVTELNASDSGCEYVYAFTEDGKTMVVLSSYCENGSKMIGAFGSGDPNATWKVIGEIKLDGPEPDWDTEPIVQDE